MVTGSLQASYRGAVRKYGFEGEAGREGEGVTRITESSYRRCVGGIVQSDSDITCDRVTDDGPGRADSRP